MYDLLKKKALSLRDYTVEHDLDILTLTETWLHSGKSDNLFVGEWKDAWKDIFSIIIPERTQEAVQLVF